MDDRAGARVGEAGAAPPQSKSTGAQPRRAKTRGAPPTLFGALDLGTNNCRLLVATRAAEGFRVVDAYSRIVRLGEGLANTGALSEAAMDRALEALKVCAMKLTRKRVAKVRCVATQACRGASNGAAFIERVKAETGLSLDIIDPREESRLAVMGCLNLIDRAADAVLVIDIGGGSTELSLIDVAKLRTMEAAGRVRQPPIASWVSAPVGVVTLAERFPERDDRDAWYEEICAHARDQLNRGLAAPGLRAAFGDGRGHLIGTSGTVTSLAGVHLGLARYDRSQVDGLWVGLDEALAVSRRLRNMGRMERAAQPCIGHDRADLVLAGCAILDAVALDWPAQRLRVADRGLREGILLSMMQARRRKRRGRNRKRKRPGAAAA